MIGQAIRSICLAVIAYFFPTIFGVWPPVFSLLTDGSIVLIAMVVLFTSIEIELHKPRM